MSPTFCRTLLTGASLIATLVVAASCKKTAELPPPTEDAGAAAAFASETGAGGDDAGPKPGTGRPRNLSVAHGTALLRTKLDACYATALAARPDEKGATELSLSIAIDGHVKDAKVSGSALSNDTLDCMRHAAEAFTFDPLDKDTAIMVPLYFAPKPDGGHRASDIRHPSGRDGGPR